MKLLTCLLVNNACYKAGDVIVPKGVMVHSTGSNNKTLRRYVQPAKSDPKYNTLIAQLGKNLYGNDWNSTKRQVCVHAFIGLLKDGTVTSVQTLPWDRRGWHSGSGNKGSANDTHISFEICEDNLKDAAYFSKVYAEAVELTAHICKQYGLDPLADGVVICHSEGYKRGVANNHGDVMHWFPRHGKTMDDFRKDVAAAMQLKPTGPFTVRVSRKDLNMRTGPGPKYGLIGQIPVGVYTIVEQSGKWGRLKAKQTYKGKPVDAWIHLDYVTKR